MAMINSEHIFLDDLQKHVFKVPDYQRPFVWKTGFEIGDFWDDFEQVSKDLKKNKKTEFFLGTIIFLQKSENGQLEVIDGQQRLTTLFIFMMALRHVIQNWQKDTDIQGIAPRLSYLNGFLSSYDVVSAQSIKHKLIASLSIRSVLSDMCREDWKPPFSNKINGKGVKLQNRKVEPIFNFFVEKLISNKSPSDISNIIQTLQKISFIRISIKEEEHAYELFERTNARGAGLEVSDLLKNHMFKNIKDDIDGESVNVMWQEIEANSEKSIIPMLRYYYISRKNHITRSKLYRGLKSYVGVDHKDKLKDIHRFSKFYQLYRNHDRESDLLGFFPDYAAEKINFLSEDSLYYIYQSLSGIKLFGVTQVIPLIYTVFHKYIDLDLHKEKDTKNKFRYRNLLSNFCESLENYHFINNFIGTRVGNDVEKLYARYAYELFETEVANDFVSKLKELYSDLKDQLIPLDEFEASFIESSYEKDTKKLLYIFDRFNSYQYPSMAKRLSSSDWKQINIYKRNTVVTDGANNIEHWMNQSQIKPTPDYVHNIGNLLAISKKVNSSMQNLKTPSEKYGFLNKNRHLISFPYNAYFIDKYKDNFQDWGEEEINNRAKDLARDAYNHIWKFDPKI